MNGGLVVVLELLQFLPVSPVGFLFARFVDMLPLLLNTSFQCKFRKQPKGGTKNYT